ncbi:MAG: hypothetical protein ACPKQO_00540 [Nitrososphaeraceae archaeon]
MNCSKETQHVQYYHEWDEETQKITNKYRCKKCKTNNHTHIEPIKIDQNSENISEI